MAKINLKFLSVLTIVFICTSFTAKSLPSSDPQLKITSISQKRTVVDKINKSLPDELVDGMIFTKVELSPSGNLLTNTFRIDPKKMLGISVSNFKKLLNTMTHNGVCEFFGEDFVEVLEMLDCDGRYIIIFPDGTQSTVSIPKNNIRLRQE